ncbi:MAG: Crp/Fnr family transcriptional regulator [bacterium]
MERPLAVRHCMDCAACAVRAGSLAAGVDADCLQRLDRTRVSHRYQRGQTLFYEGNPAGAVFCVGTAYAKVVRTAPHGRRHALSVAGPGDVLGLEAVLTGQPYAYGAEVLAEGVVCQLERTEILDLAEHHPAFRRAAIQLLADTLRQSQGERAQLAGGDVRERTAHVLLTLATRFGEWSNGRLQLYLELSREDLAEMIGVAVETAIRQLSELRRRGILSTTGRCIVVEDPERLARLARAVPTPTR